MTPVDPFQGLRQQLAEQPGPAAEEWGRPAGPAAAMCSGPGDAAAPADKTRPDHDIDLEPVRQVLLREARGGVTLERIDDVLRRLLTRDFHDVRLVIYLPIFLLRAARQVLRVEAR